MDRIIALGLLFIIIISIIAPIIGTTHDFEPVQNAYETSKYITLLDSRGASPAIALYKFNWSDHDIGPSDTLFAEIIIRATVSSGILEIGLADSSLNWTSQTIAFSNLSVILPDGRTLPARVYHYVIIRLHVWRYWHTVAYIEDPGENLIASADLGSTPSSDTLIVLARGERGIAGVNLTGVYFRTRSYIISLNDTALLPPQQSIPTPYGVLENYIYGPVIALRNAETLSARCIFSPMETQRNYSEYGYEGWVEAVSYVGNRLTVVFRIVYAYNYYKWLIFEFNPYTCEATLNKIAGEDTAPYHILYSVFALLPAGPNVVVAFQESKVEVVNLSSDSIDEYDLNDAFLYGYDPIMGYVVLMNRSQALVITPSGQARYFSITGASLTYPYNPVKAQIAVANNSILVLMKKYGGLILINLTTGSATTMNSEGVDSIAGDGSYFYTLNSVEGNLTILSSSWSTIRIVPLPPADTLGLTSSLDSALMLSVKYEEEARGYNITLFQLDYRGIEHLWTHYIHSPTLDPPNPRIISFSEDLAIVSIEDYKFEWSALINEYGNVTIANYSANKTSIPILKGFYSWNEWSNLVLYKYSPENQVYTISLLSTGVSRWNQWRIYHSYLEPAVWRTETAFFLYIFDKQNNTVIRHEVARGADSKLFIQLPEGLNIYRIAPVIGGVAYVGYNYSSRSNYAGIVLTSGVHYNAEIPYQFNSGQIKDIIAVNTTIYIITEEAESKLYMIDVINNKTSMYLISDIVKEVPGSLLPGINESLLRCSLGGAYSELSPEGDKAHITIRLELKEQYSIYKYMTIYMLLTSEGWRLLRSLDYFAPSAVWGLDNRIFIPGVNEVYSHNGALLKNYIDTHVAQAQNYIQLVSPITTDLIVIPTAPSIHDISNWSIPAIVSNNGYRFVTRILQNQTVTGTLQGDRVLIVTFGGHPLFLPKNYRIPPYYPLVALRILGANYYYMFKQNYNNSFTLLCSDSKYVLVAYDNLGTGIGKFKCGDTIVPSSERHDIYVGTPATFNNWFSFYNLSENIVVPVIDPGNISRSNWIIAAEGSPLCFEVTGPSLIAVDNSLYTVSSIDEFIAGRSQIWKCFDLPVGNHTIWIQTYNVGESEYLAIILPRSVQLYSVPNETTSIPTHSHITYTSTTTPPRTTHGATSIPTTTSPMETTSEITTPSKKPWWILIIVLIILVIIIYYRYRKKEL